MTKPSTAEEILKSLQETFPQLAKFFGLTPAYRVSPQVIEMPFTENGADYLMLSKEEYIALLDELEQNQAWVITDTMVRWGEYLVKIGPSVTYTKAKFLREFLDWKHDSV